MPTPNVLLRHERQLRGWSQGRLAEQIDVPDYYISRWERGEVLPSPYYQQKLCELLGKSAEELGFLQVGPETPLPGTLRLEDGSSVPSVETGISPGNAAPVLTDELTEQASFPPQAVPSSAPLPSSLPEHSSVPAERESFPSTFPALPTTPLHESRRPRQRSVLLRLALVVLLLLIGAGSILFFVVARRPIAAPAIVGQVYLRSSGQFNDATNQGMADQVRVELYTLPEPAAG